jgi:hypothetical protein
MIGNAVRSNILSQHITFAILADGRPSIALVAPAFLACALFAYEVVRRSTSLICWMLLTIFVGIQQFILLIQQVQAPEDLAAAPVPPRPTAPSTQSPSPPVNTTNAPPTGVTNGQNTTAPLTSQRPPGQEMTWFSVIRSVLRFIWYDEHNRICAPISLSSPPFHHLMERTGLVGYFVFIVLVLVVRVVVAPGLAAIFLAVLYSSIWAPQIVRAARRGRPCALGMKYIVGTTIGRMLLALCTASFFNRTVRN